MSMNQSDDCSGPDAAPAEEEAIFPGLEAAKANQADIQGEEEAADYVDLANVYGVGAVREAIAHLLKERDPGVSDAMSHRHPDSAEESRYYNFIDLGRRLGLGVEAKREDPRLGGADLSYARIRGLTVDPRVAYLTAYGELLVGPTLDADDNGATVLG